MSSDLPIDPYEALEPSLTALLLGELTEAQAEPIRRAIHSDPALARKFEQLRYTISLVREVEAPAAVAIVAESTQPARLCEERRQQLLQAFKTVRPETFKPAARRESRWLVPAAAACAVISTIAALLILGSPRTVRRMAKLPSTPTDMEIRRKLARGDSAPAPVSDGQTVPPTDRWDDHLASPLSSSIELSASRSATSPDGAVKLLAEGVVLPKEPNLAPADASNPDTGSAVVDFDKNQPGKTEESLKRASGDVSSGPGQTATGVGSGAGGFGGAAANRSLSFGDQPQLGDIFSKDAKRVTRDESDQLPLGRDEKGLGIDSVSKSELREPSNADNSKRDNYFGYSAPQPKNGPNESAAKPARSYALAGGHQTPQTGLPQLLSDMQAQEPAAATPDSDATTLWKLGETKQKLSGPVANAGGRPFQQPAEAKELDANSLVSNGRREREKQQIDKEDLGLAQTVAALQPQPEIQTKDQAASTFSLNVSDVSFRLAAASFEQGKFPAPGSIRTEEFLNAVDYRDPAPASGQRVAFAWDRATDPFAQNRDLLRLSVKTAAVGREPGRPLNLVLLLDNSGSMERSDRVGIIRQALRVVGSQLRTNDTLSVVTFARTARLFADGVSADQAGRVAEELGQLPPQGGTNLEEAMSLAYQTALRHYFPNGVNRVVLLTDGAANLGNTNPETLKQKVEANRKQGIALDCFGIGWEGYNDDLLEQLTRHGDGRYGFLNTPQEASTEFADKLAGALQVAAADVKVQVEFNKARVTSYRQVGYAQHQLKKEQFRDNTVDAAEIGAGESGNALYVIETAPQGEGPLGVFRVRYKVPGTNDYREQEWTIPYTGTAVALDKAGAGTRLAAVGSTFAELLAGSPYAAGINPDQLLSYLNGIPAEYGVDPRPHKLEWMLHQAKALGGK
jgi:Mg-chelatase subunit ChlD